MRKKSGVILLSTADWDLPLWTNKQHTARSLRDAGFRVLYVESTGLRRPRLSDVVDGRRILRRLARAIRPPRQVETEIFVWSPPVIPAATGRISTAMNWLILTILIAIYGRIYAGNDPVVWTYNPVSMAIMRMPKNQQLVYHCVDDISAQPGVNSSYIDEHEPGLVMAADHVFVTSRALERKWSALRNVVYDPNCVDAAHFESGGGESERLAHIPRPRVGFVGAVAAYKIDTAVLRAIAKEEWSLVIAGPREDEDLEISEVLGRPNVYYLGAVEYGDLPSIVSAFDVGIIPARTGKYAASMFPMKFFEYLASGIPVVTTRLPALEEYTAVASIVSPDEFVGAVRKAIDGNVPPIDARKAVYQDHTYSARTYRMLRRLGSENNAGQKRGDEN